MRGLQSLGLNQLPQAMLRQMKKVIELIRVSTEAQASTDRASIPAQRAVNRRTCAQYGLEIVRSIEITDVSGACVLLAPEMQQLVQAMRSPDVALGQIASAPFFFFCRPDSLQDFGPIPAIAALIVPMRRPVLLFRPSGPSRRYSTVLESTNT